MKCSTLSLAFFLSLLLIILTTSCSSKWHLKKALQKDLGHHLKGRYNRDRKEQLPSEDYAKLRHPNNRWRM